MPLNSSQIYILFVVFVHVGCSGSQDLFQQAKRIAAQKWTDYEKLYEKYNVSSTDYFFPFGSEDFGPSKQGKQAWALVEYQRLLKHYGNCKLKTFKDCVNEAAKTEIPLKERCQVPNASCNAHEKYSRISGLCNNLHTPTLGKSNTPYSHWLQPIYADGISKIRKSVSNQDLPNPRVMGNILDTASDFQSGTVKCGDHTNNFAGLMFSQLIAHDISSRAVVTIKGNGSNPIRCCNSANTRPIRKSHINPNCIPIRLPANDSFYADKGIFCQAYIRMSPTLEPNCKVKYAHENIESHFLDLSPIYSTEDSALELLRAKSDGLFQLDPRNILPLDAMGNYTSGDFRFGQTTVLALTYSLFYQFHNVIARGLKGVNPHWKNDKLFFETRRLAIAIYQHIIYYGWLPLVMDKDILHHRNVICETEPCGEYDATIDPSSMNEFANGAFKFFHANIPSNIHLANASYDVIKKVRFSSTYSVLDTLADNYDKFLCGLLRQKQRNNRVGYSGEIRNLFIRTKYRGHDVGVDGFMIDVMRNRDSGIVPFIDFYGPCMSKKIKVWDDLKPFFEPKHFDVLRSIYENVKDIDLMTALLLEKRCKNWIGKIGACIMAEQFHRYKYGDRFFYSHPNNPHKFTSDQLRDIRKMTFAKIICMTRSIEKVPRNGFIALSKDNPLVRCKELGTLNFELFRNER